MKIGFIGTGVMGSRMVSRLLDAGHDVSVFNRSFEKAALLVKQGAVHKTSIKELIKDSQIICTCLSMPADVKEVYLGEDGIIHHAKKKIICLDFTTVDADTSKEIFTLANEKEISYLDAPVSGGPEGAQAGSLTIMVGGEEAVFQVVLPVLSVLGHKIEYLGKAGSGSIAKLINQYLVAVHSIAASEAMVTGAAFGLDSEQLYKILKVSYGHSRMLERHMEHYVLKRDFAPGGAVKYVYKDIRLANVLVKNSGLKQFMGQLAEQSFEKAIEEGLADLDMSAVIQPLEKEADVIVSRNDSSKG